LVQFLGSKPEDLQEQCPGLIYTLNSYLPKKKILKETKPRKKKNIGILIDEIIADVEEKQLCSE
jgi:hypothetical protein